MHRFLILLVLAGIAPMLAAQDAAQPLPSAPSATKYPPKQTVPPPAPAPAPSSQQKPAPATDGTSASSAPADSAAAPSPAALPRGTATAAPAGGDDEPLTTITKRVDE